MESALGNVYTWRAHCLQDFRIYTFIPIRYLPNGLSGHAGKGLNIFITGSGSKMTLETLKEQIRPADRESMRRAQEHWMTVGKPLFSLGKLEDAVIRMAGIKGTHEYELMKKGLVILCADNGVVEEGHGEIPL